jgi:opacity protein-like surface antigen
VHTALRKTAAAKRQTCAPFTGIGELSREFGGSHAQVVDWISRFAGARLRRVGRRLRASGPADGAGIRASSEIDAFGTVRGRLGVAWDRFMIYGTGGAIFANVRTSHFWTVLLPLAPSILQVRS